MLLSGLPVPANQSSSFVLLIYFLLKQTKEKAIIAKEHL